MNATEKIINWLTGGSISKIVARYEAALFSVGRSYLPGVIADPRYDMSSYSRIEIQRKVRYFEKNSNTMLKALGILDVNVVGTGINPTPFSSNESWNKKALAWWNDWSNVADITGTSTVPEMQSIVFRAQCVDGDHGIELTENEFGRPAINLIESHRISSGSVDSAKMKAAGYEIIDGVVVDLNGKPVAYLVTSDYSGKTAAIPASQFVFFYRKRRAGQYRGISDFHAAVLDLHDLDDLQKYEMAAAKDAASTSKIFKATTGAVTPENAIGGSLNPQTSTDPLSRQAQYRQALGGETLVLFPGDSLEQTKNERPSAATNGFWDRLENKFVQGSGLSYAALVDYRGTWGGATLRAAVTSDNRLFSLRTNEQARKWQKVWEYAIGWAMDHGELERNPEFKKVRWHPPRRTTVDIGNESAATLNELKAGIRTFETVYGEAGDDWQERLEQRAVEEKFISDLATKYGVERELISSFAQERVTVTAATMVDPTTDQPAEKGGGKGANE